MNEEVKNPGCPMTIEFCKENKITDSQVKRFCALGCSVDCDKLLREALAKRKGIKNEQ